ncbi:unnamed protein product, partial [Ilex paraguariensis]
MLPYYTYASPPRSVNPLCLTLLPISIWKQQGLRRRCSIIRSSISTHRPIHLLRDSRSSMADSHSSVVLQSLHDGDGNLDSVKPQYAEIIVVRHGETEWNADNRIQGHIDIDLNEVGRQQAVAVADQLSREPKISAVYSSDLKRAFETAEVIASCCGGLE